jgi:hypothetical protein
MRGRSAPKRLAKILGVQMFPIRGFWKRTAIFLVTPSKQTGRIYAGHRGRQDRPSQQGEVQMSVLASLIHFSRAIIQAHNNAKARNLIEGSPLETRKDAGRRAAPGAPEKGPQTGGR